MSAFAELIAGFIGWFTNSARRYLNDTRHDLPVLEEKLTRPRFYLDSELNSGCGAVQNPLTYNQKSAEPVAKLHGEALS